MTEEDEQYQLWSLGSNALNLSTEGNYKFIFYVFYLEVFCCVVSCKANLVYPGMDEAPVMIPQHYHHFPFLFRCSHSWLALYVRWELGQTAGDVSPSPFLLRDAARAPWGGERDQSLASCRHPFASSWATLTVFNLLNLYVSNAKHQGGSFRSVITAGEETQPRAPHLSTWSERLHHSPLQENEYTLNTLTNAMNFCIKPISGLIVPTV